MSLLRLVGAVLTLACVVFALYVSDISADWGSRWWWLGAALLLAILWQWRLSLPGAMLAARPPEGAPLSRIALGLAIGLAGAALWGWAITGLFQSWALNFDRSWGTLPVAAATLGVGLDVAWGRWPRRDGTPRARRLVLSLLSLLALAAVYRFWKLTSFPGPAGITQVEDLQTGMMGLGYLGGGRNRWEYLSWAWLAAVGVWLGGPTLNAMRIPFAVVSVLKGLPLFLWLRFAVGTVGALVGTALFTFSAYDVILSRIPNNHDALIVAIAFALLAGPARRGRPSAYVWLGLFGGYVLYEYVAYRPLAFFVVAGAAWLSFRDANARLIARLGRPLITLALIVTMALPLFLRVLSPPDRIWSEYFNGWNRARVIGPYYDPQDTWRAAIEKRVDRSFEATALFFFTGDSHPARRVSQPLVDHVTAAFLVVGVACAVAHIMEPIFGLTLVAALATVAGTMVMTGNFDIGRVGGVVPYIYALVGYGAASLAALAEGRSRLVRLTVLGLLAAAVLWAGWLNTRALFEHWSSPSVRRAQRSNLAYLSSWLGNQVQPGERVVAIAPGYFNVLESNDAAWLRGREMDGIVTWDIEAALRYWAQQNGKTLLLGFAGASTPDVREYLEWLLPGLKMSVETDPLNLGGDLVYAHLEQTPAALSSAVAAARCRGVRAEYRLVGPSADGAALNMSAVLPFIDGTTWPGEVRGRLHQMQTRPPSMTVRFQADFVVRTAGDYSFASEGYPGKTALVLDGQQYASQVPSVHLESGSHRMELNATLEPEPNLMSVSLLWKGPDSLGQSELMPFYRISPADASCAGEGGVDPQPHG